MGIVSQEKDFPVSAEEQMSVENCLLEEQNSASEKNGLLMLQYPGSGWEPEHNVNEHECCTC